MAQVLRLLLAAACTALSAGLGSALLTVARTTSLERVDDVVTLGVIALGLLVLAWYTLTGLVSCLVLLARVVAGGDWRAGEAWLRSSGAPLLRRLAVAGVAGSVSIGAVTPAWAAPAPPMEPAATATADADPPAPAEEDPGPDDPIPGDLPLDLGWPVSEPTTDSAPPRPGAGTGVAPASPVAEPPTASATGPTAQSTDEPAAEQADGPTDEPAAPQPPTPHVVRRGESLWSITAGALERVGLPAGDSDIAAAWPRLYEANAALVGPDPDLILPGQELHIPSFKEEQ